MINSRKLASFIAPMAPAPLGREKREERRENREERIENIFPLSSFLFPLSSFLPRSSAPLLLCLLLPTPAIPFGIASLHALPPPEDLPEEILRTEIITEARSPIDGQPITPAEYAQLQLQQPELWTDNPNIPTETAAFSATSHIMNKYPIRDLLRQMFPF